MVSDLLQLVDKALQKSCREIFCIWFWLSGTSYGLLKLVCKQCLRAFCDVFKFKQLKSLGNSLYSDGNQSKAVNPNIWDVRTRNYLEFSLPKRIKRLTHYHNCKFSVHRLIVSPVINCKLQMSWMCCVSLTPLGLIWPCFSFHSPSAPMDFLL